MAQRFRGFLPVVIDVETGGLNPETDALLELAAITLTMDDQGHIQPDTKYYTHIKPFDQANIEESSRSFLGYDPHSALRYAIEEQQMWNQLLPDINETLKKHKCQRAILVGHNAFFDLGFIKASLKRCGYKKDPFHSFTTLDTASLAGLVYGQTVLAKACRAAGIDFDNDEAHSAEYDTEKTTELFCNIINYWQDKMGGPINKYKRKKNHGTDAN